MPSLLGPFLRHLRQSHGLSQFHVAQQASIGRVTLNRWESGKQNPRVLELQAVLKSLQATPDQIAQAVQLLGTTEVRSQKMANEEQVAMQTGIGPRPHGGSLLLALRLRSGLSQEEAALRVGVTTRTLRRWEKAETWPDDSQLHTLCYVLGAHSEEIMALTTGGAKLEMGAPNEEPTLDELEERIGILHYHTNDQHLEALKDLGFLVLEAQAWPLAARSKNGRQLLSYIYSCHANRCSAHERWSEGSVYAHRSLDLLSSDDKPHNGAIQAAIASARCATYQGARPTPSRGLEILQHWLDVTIHPVLQSWILSDMAKYGSLDGDASQNLNLARRAREAVTGTEFSYDLYLRELDEAQILLQSGEATQALDILERERQGLQDEHLIQFRVLEAEAALKLSNPGRATECLQQAQQLIDEWSLFHFQPRVQKVIEQI